MPKSPPPNSNRTSKPGSPRTTSIPKTGQPSVPAPSIKSIVRKILLASPDFPRLYADVVISSAPNSNEAKILAANYEKIVERTNMSNPKSCTHIKVIGVRCGSPPLRGEQFCYFHQRMLRTVKGPPSSRVHHAALLEDEESIQASLMEVVNGLLRGTIEIKRAELILRALNTAVRNSRRVKFGNSNDIVTEIPDYATPPATDADDAARDEAARQATHTEIARVRAAHLEAANAGTAHVGAAAPGCPGGPESPGRSPTPKQNAAVDPTQRKPPVSDRSAQKPQSRKQRASSG
jgi:hypothetical protein